jgi:hypothetical protein
MRSFLPCRREYGRHCLWHLQAFASRIFRIEAAAGEVSHPGSPCKHTKFRASENKNILGPWCLLALNTIGA